MKTVSMALIGDVHFPDNKIGKEYVDQKDGGITSRIVTRIGPNPLKTVSEALRNRLCIDDTIRAVLLCGDLTTKGDMGSYAECVSYFEQVLDLSNPDFWKDKELHVVPGNHDISRHSIDPSDANIYKKFEDIKRVWAGHGRTEMQPDTVRTTDTATDNGGVARIFSVNSCVGCGEHRQLSPALRSTLEQVLSKYVTGALPLNPFDLINEQLDTPVIDDGHLSMIEESISRLQRRSSVPVLLAHHGLLPQSIPRVQIYSELLNSGRVRHVLSNYNRPVIYCHGHLHEDPIEIVSNANGGTGKLIVISAPLFVDGFNVIRIEFNGDGVPIGCEISRYRVENGSVTEKEPARIPLLVDPLTIEENSTLRHALTAVTHASRRFKSVSADVATLRGAAIPDDELADVLLELEWMGLVEITNRREPEKRHWHIRKVAP